jgi:predicted ATPase
LKKGQILIVEQPEIHLHPKAQAELGSFFCDLSKRNIQTFIETHSEHLLLRIQSHIAIGDLNPEDVKVYYVFANKNTDRKEVEEIKLNKNGTFLTEWPEGFFPERLVEVKKIAKASLKGK